MARRYHHEMMNRAQAQAAEHQEYYAGRDARRELEHKDSEMLGEDHSAFANMPQQVVMREYPKAHGYFMKEYLDDSISGVDRQMDGDNAKKMQHLKPWKV